MIDAYVLEWSQKTNNFHIQPLSSKLAQNQGAFILNKQITDYIVLMVGTLDVVQTMAENSRYKLAHRAKNLPNKVAI